MATLFLAAAGTAIGGGLGGSLAGLASAALGKAAGATFGSMIDQKLLGLGSDPVETGRVERFRVMGGSEGAVLPRVYGRVRVAGQMIWSSRFLETVNTSNVGGKGGGQQVREYSYTVSFAVALCEGPVVRVGRIWADGQVLDQSSLNWRLHTGTEDQLPDPLIAAIEGSDAAPAYRGVAYVVFEDLDLTPFGNRVPQLNFEVFRRPKRTSDAVPEHPADLIRGVALVPGTGEYALATDVVSFDRGKGDVETVNIHNDLGIPDLIASTAQMTAELPALRSVSLVVTWFGNDLRCDRCALVPAVEQTVEEATLPWRVSGIGRDQARVVSWVDGRPLFGGTPADASVIQAIQHLRGLGKAVLFYPFIMMDILAGNGLRDPWSGAPDQPAVPWRGRITLSMAPGQEGSPDRQPAAAAEVAAFFGAAGADDFKASESTVAYSGPDEWSYRRFILHYAHLCALAGGVDAFCFGSEMRGLTQIRSGIADYPAVAALRALAGDVRSILGPDVKIGYAADWSEYFGHQPNDGTGDVLFNLDPLWSDTNVDFIGIDNYMPLSDWRSEDNHTDAAHGAIYSLDYLVGNVAGGEGYDWYYPSAEARNLQDRRQIEDGAEGEDWVFRYKDIRNWWASTHHDRPGGLRASDPTDWIPCSKPIWFTELGCPAVDRGTNQPNVFVDSKSSESLLPYFSEGARDDLIQLRYLQATFAYWSDEANNPVSSLYGGSMIDLDHAHVWAWDARPWPDFPARRETWADGENYALGHWLNGRTSTLSVAEVVAEIANAAGINAHNVSRLHSPLTGYTIANVESGRQSLQPLMLACGFDAYAAGEGLAFVSRDGGSTLSIDDETLVRQQDAPVVSRTRAPISETTGRVTLSFVRGDDDYQAGAVEASWGGGQGVSQSETAIVLRVAQAQAIVDRWLAEGSVGRDTIEFALPPSAAAAQPGDVLRFGGDRNNGALYRIDKIDDSGSRLISAIRVERGACSLGVYADSSSTAPKVNVSTPIYAELLDLPLLTGDETAHAPWAACIGGPSGGVAIYSASEDFGYSLNRILHKQAIFGETKTPLRRAAPGLWMPASLDVRLRRGALQSRSTLEILNGANVAAIRAADADWEVFQFQFADLIDTRSYRLSGLLRGQAGTDGIMPDMWPEGSDFVLLDSALMQLELPLSARGLERHHRIGPAARSYDHRDYRHFTYAAQATGLRPYVPAHLAADRLANGDIRVGWVRRTRIDGDSWQGEEVPLGEEYERYAVRITSGGTPIREVEVSTTELVYRTEEQVEDGVNCALAFEVAQVSAQFGRGPFGRIAFHG